MPDPIDMFLGVGQRVTNNLKGTFDNMSPEKWIRLVIVVGAYMLLRPYLLKFASKTQMAQIDQEQLEAENRAKLSPNDLRGRVEIPEDSEDDDEGQPSGADWGKKARRRQRKVIKKMLDEHEKKLAEEQEDEEDKDIEEFLIKD